MQHLVERIFTETLAALRSTWNIEGELPRFTVTTPKNPEHGDFAVNAALTLAKPTRCKPRDLAQQIAAGLIDPAGVITRTEVAGPGFINLWLDDSVWRGVIGEIEAAGAEYGHHRGTPRGRINLEFVSANPTGPLHVGHGRGAVVGDALARLLDAAGYEVTREYYTNDAGNQVDVLARSIHLRYQEQLGRNVVFPVEAYPADYVREIAVEIAARDGDRWLDQPEHVWMEHFRSFGIERNMDAIRADLAALGVGFDVWSSEAELHATGKVTALVVELTEKGLTYQAEHSMVERDQRRRKESKAAKHATDQRGGTFVRLSAYGDDDDRILLRSDGTPVYLAADLCYHREKVRRGYDLCIDVFGADHFAHTRTLKAGLQALDEADERLDFVLTQIVRLLRGGVEVRLSKRAGNIELLADLLQAVGGDATRFFFLLRAPSAQFDFDLDVATRHSLDNPVFYVQYGHARTCALFRRAEQEGVDYRGFDVETMRCLTLPEELTLLRKMAAFPALIDEAAHAREPHRLVYYVEDLIRTFHSYYTRHKKTGRIISSDDRTTQARLGLVKAVRQVVANVLALLGVGAPERMKPVEEDEEEGE